MIATTGVSPTMIYRRRKPVRCGACQGWLFRRAEEFDMWQCEGCNMWYILGKEVERGG